MKFLCNNCKAKYQISDEKVEGRTLRMRCRACKAEIVIRGDNVAASAPPPGSVRPPPGSVRPPPASARPAPGSLRPPAPISALGAGFQARVQGGLSDDVSASADEWHVAINDIPVGPMRRDELGRKIEIGAVGPESLAWREGMDDWMPVKQIPDLAVLVGRRGSVMPPVPRVAPSAMDPGERSNVPPIGGRFGATPAPLDNWLPPARESSAPAPLPRLSSPLEESGAGQQPQRWAPMFFGICVFAFLMTALAIFGAHWLRKQDEPQVAAAPPPAAVAPIEAPRPTPRMQMPEEEEEVADEMVIELDSLEIEDEGQPRPRSKAAAKPAVAPKPQKQLTAAQRAMLDQMGDDFGGPAKLDQRTTKSAGSGSGVGQLTAGQLSKVVLGGRRNLQRCYETALRGAQSDETVRMDVKITVSPSGNVTQVSTVGKGLPGMDTCIARTVRMWRFPASDSGAQTAFPVVFQPGA